MSDEKDPPIIPADFVGGVRVVDIGDVRVARGLSRRHHASCPHRQMVYDRQERRIWCPDCEHDIEHFDAFEELVRHFHTESERLRLREIRLAEAEAFQIRTLAAKQIDKAWRAKRTVPACPSCGNGLFPEDFKNGVPSTLGRDYASRLRERSKRK